MFTRKQKAVVKELSENVGLSVGQAMRNVGYSHSTALQPQRLTDSDGFQELAKRFLKDDKILEVAERGLNADKTIRYKGKTFKDPDYYARHQYLETALRIRKLINPDNQPVGDINIQVINYADADKPINIDVKAGKPKNIKQASNSA